MDTYFHVTATFWRSEDGHQWSVSLHPYVPEHDAEPDVRFHGSGQITFADAHNIAGTLRSVLTDLLIRHAGVQLELF